MIRKIISKIINKFKKKKPFVSCRWLEHGLIFDHANYIRVCCAQSHEGKGRYILKQNYYGEQIDWDEIFSEKQKMRDVQRSGKIHPSCTNCIFLENNTWDNGKYIDMLLLTHWVNCNTACVYCPAIRDEELFRVNKHYNILPVLKDMTEKKLLKKHAYISIAGGESTIHPEFDEILKLFLSYGIKYIDVNTSGIKYSQALAEGINKGVVHAVISLDSGTREVYQKIKTTDSFNMVIENVRKYVQHQKRDNKFVTLKYIFLKDINDNEKELSAFLELCNNEKIKSIALDIDINWYRDGIEKPHTLLWLIIFAKTYCNKYKIKLTLFDRASILEKEYKLAKTCKKC